MKYSFLLSFLFIISFSFSQIVIKGTVYQNDGPMEGAAVYFNNSMIGTTTNEKGEFSLKTKEGQYDLIVSFLGYKTINYSLITSEYKKPLVFAMLEDENLLDEIVIRNTVYDDDWKYNLKRFEKAFIGTSSLAKDCEITNPKVLHFEYDYKTKTLKAYPKKPLIIKNKSLGYLITYDLVDFKIQDRYVSYLGYARYQELKGSKRKKRKWKAKREKAYYGSYTHFYQSILRKKTYEEGFLVHLFKRVPNPERPSEAEIKRAREIIKLNLGTINFGKKITNPKTILDSARVTLNKVRLPKFKDNLYRTKAPISDVITKENRFTYFNPEYNITVVYTKENEEREYIVQNAKDRNREAYPQSSNIVVLEKPTAIDINGVLVNPLNVYYEGYWAYEKFANSLPLDYQPFFSKQ